MHKRLLEVDYLVVEYEIAKHYKQRIPPVAHAKIRQWRKEREVLLRAYKAWVFSCASE
jgi:hypothetical protein